MYEPLLVNSSPSRHELLDRADRHTRAALLDPVDRRGRCSLPARLPGLGRRSAHGVLRRLQPAVRGSGPFVGHGLHGHRRRLELLLGFGDPNLGLRGGGLQRDGVPVRPERRAVDRSRVIARYVGACDVAPGDLLTG